MQAYEFYAKPENGVIRIPDEYKDKIGKRIKVIIEEVPPTSINDMLLPPTLDTRDWKFDKEEANER